MTQEHKDVILSALKEQKELILKQSATLKSQSELIERLYEVARLATETTGLMSDRIVELSKDHQLVSLIKPVNGWMN